MRGEVVEEWWRGINNNNRGNRIVVGVVGSGYSIQQLGQLDCKSGYTN